MIDETREYLLDHRGKLLFQIERAKHHLAGLQADGIKVINSKASLPAADITIITEDLAEHLRSEIEALCWAIDHIDHELEYLDGDDEFGHSPGATLARIVDSTLSSLPIIIAEIGGLLCITPSSLPHYRSSWCLLLLLPAITI
ncbi:hypothetical protein [Rhizobium sp. NXC24]|uniref:hypothetical protein n=1 Tax=Rhizobium sp. NXC24 TaxID=2048897 RepID=UPI000CDF3F27|nr:hypothetical protein [Rhizobium sp. NXC24]AVA24129.1 hypothetical protein NXC24_PB00196 [Rhizobium sp. NXC24]